MERIPFKLSKPITVGDKNPTEIREINYRHPSAADLEAVQFVQGIYSVDIELISLLTDLPSDCVRQMAGNDFCAIRERIGNFLGSGVTTDEVTKEKAQGRKKA